MHFSSLKFLFFFSTTSAEKIKADKDVAAPLKELGLRVSKFLVSDGAILVVFFPCSWNVLLLGFCYLSKLLNVE